MPRPQTQDKRATTCVLLLWMTVTCSIFYFLGAFHIHFMTFGPSPKTTFMGMTIDTWVKWNALAAFSFTNTAMNEFLGSALGPWFTNTIQARGLSLWFLYCSNVGRLGRFLAGGPLKRSVGAGDRDRLRA